MFGIEYVIKFLVGNYLTCTCDDGVMISVEICFITISILCHTVQFLPALFGRSESFSCKTKRRSAWLCGQVMPPVPLVLVTSYPLRPARRAMLEYLPNSPTNMTQTRSACGGEVIRTPLERQSPSYP